MRHNQTLLNFDRQHIWHPYTAIPSTTSIYGVTAAKGVHLELFDGRHVIDGMSSWWSVIHGYSHPDLNLAAKNQLDKMAHVMFGGLTHEPAIRLSQKLVEITPTGLDSVFLADSGSVSVEVALKMALQFWHAKGQPEKSKFMSFMHGYHGDTFGAMSVCDPENGMHHLFSGNLPKHHFVEAPPQGFTAPENTAYLQRLRHFFEAHHATTAAFIFEPIVQGAGGMRIYSPTYVAALRALCDEFNILLIADEIATGFGRTGALFACNHADITPDILTLGKALTGGYMTLAATLCKTHVSDTINQSEAGVFMHGPTFMGNPLACAIANKSLELLESNHWQDKVSTIQTHLLDELTPLKPHPLVEDVRVLGAIGVIEMKHVINVDKAQKILLENGVWLRPFGKLLYTMPIFTSSNSDVAAIANAMAQCLQGLAAEPTNDDARTT